MLKRTKILKNYKLNSLDGKIGLLEDFYFDDKFWTIRYLVANTGKWLGGRHVLLSPYAMSSSTKEGQCIDIDLTKKQIEDSPSLDSQMPVSQQFEQEYYNYYGWPTYYSGSSVWGFHSHIMRDKKDWKEFAQSEKAWDPHLHSTNVVSGYHIHAEDGNIGHIVDFIIDDETWEIRYLIIDTRNWWPGKKVLVSPKWLERVSWDESEVYINLSREDIKQSPEYSEVDLLTQDYETALHRYYNRQEYWLNDGMVK